MNTIEMKQMLNDVMTDLPQDVKLSKHESDVIVEKFIKNVSKPLESIVTSMVNETSEDGELSEADRKKFTKDLMNLVLPYFQSVADN